MTFPVTFEKAIKLNPSFSRAHYNLAVLLMDEEAIDIIQKKEKNPKHKKDPVSKKSAQN